jgi:hypothetical protein
MRIIGTTAFIKFNANKLDVASGIALAEHNLKEDSTIQIRLYDQANQAGILVFDSGIVSAGTIKPWGEFNAGTDPWSDAEWQLGDLIPQIFYNYFTQRAWHSIQIDISAPNNTTIDIGRLMIGYVFIPSRNYARRSRFDWVDTGTDRIKGEEYRVFNFDLNRLADFENDRLEIELIKSKRQGDVLVCLNPDATGLSKLKDTAVMKRENDISRTNLFQNINRQNLKFKEST